MSASPGGRASGRTGAEGARQSPGAFTRRRGLLASVRWSSRYRRPVVSRALIVPGSLRESSAIGSMCHDTLYVVGHSKVTTCCSCPAAESCQMHDDVPLSPAFIGYRQFATPLCAVQAACPVHVRWPRCQLAPLRSWPQHGPSTMHGRIP
ncbi:hypothetical protein BV25DRAFT_707458 [Artomyces pyxidatus]|uniref:Uncharacterized protein n=1 Tax=Artomyces pyxidatus TaxID=48021 RepID=A0ACB8T0X4_9AGAM|nr:hypothetical protein BV25DRAFT_707458 [Artomyces pyxidatus]